MQSRNIPVRPNIRLATALVDSHLESPCVRMHAIAFDWHYRVWVFDEYLISWFIYCKCRRFCIDKWIGSGSEMRWQLSAEMFFFSPSANKISNLKEEQIRCRKERIFSLCSANNTNKQQQSICALTRELQFVCFVFSQKNKTGIMQIKSNWNQLAVNALHVATISTRA